jgi:glucosamine 6-phosphate synthetase-like amidotransferase/phosphosugar isomerase protein
MPKIISRRPDDPRHVTVGRERREIVELQLRGVRPGTTISVTNQLSNSLSDWADVRRASMAGPEMTVSSKSYTGGLACLHILGAALLGGLAGARRHPHRLRRRARRCR